ncbi:MAG: hypothetical protein RI953_1470 [Pseudomonadota bacterium]|jgi:hypothetical protein
MKSTSKKPATLSAENKKSLMLALRQRFETNMNRHMGLRWKDIEERLESQPEKVWSLSQMESSGGEPDVVGLDSKSGEFIFFDCSAESPSGRRSLCYDRSALDARKENKPKSNAIDEASNMGIDILDQEQYRFLQTLGKFDAKTSSWVKTPLEIRKLGGAIFCDFRYGTVFTYHNGAESYYAARGFRGVLRV